MLLCDESSEMPPGTIGFEAIGEVEDDDWEKEVEPILRARDGRGPEDPPPIPARPGGPRGRGRRDDRRYRLPCPLCGLVRPRRGGQRRELDAARDAGALVPAPRQGRALPVAELEAAKAWVAENGT